MSRSYFFNRRDDPELKPHSNFSSGFVVLSDLQRDLPLPTCIESKLVRPRVVRAARVVNGHDSIAGVVRVVIRHDYIGYSRVGVSEWLSNMT